MIGFFVISFKNICTCELFSNYSEFGSRGVHTRTFRLRSSTRLSVISVKSASLTVERLYSFANNWIYVRPGIGVIKIPSQCGAVRLVRAATLFHHMTGIPADQHGFSVRVQLHQFEHKARLWQIRRPTEQVVACLNKP